MCYTARVDLGGASQSGYPNNAYKLIPWTALRCQSPGSGIWVGTNGGGFTLPCGVALFQWQVWAGSGFGGSNPQFVAKLIKNAGLSTEEDIVAAIGVGGGQPGTAVCGASVSELVIDATDLYQLFLFSSASDPLVGTEVDGNKAHTFFSATIIPG